MRIFSELWDYREMIKSLVKRDLKIQYKGSVLGFMWMILVPLFQLVIYTFAFSIIMRVDQENYYLFMFVALIPWLFFSNCLSSGANAVFSQQDMVKKIYFPREVLPLSYVIMQLVNMMLSFVVVFAVIIFSGISLNLFALLWLIPIVLIEFCLCLGVTYVVSALDIYFRDIAYIMGILSMAWMYVTPIVYSETMVPERFRMIYNLNPMTGIIVAYRDILFYSRVPNLPTIIYPACIAIVSLIVGHVVFDYLQGGFVEEL